MDIAQLLLTDDENNIFLVEDYYYYLITLIEILSEYDASILVLITSEDQREYIPLLQGVDIYLETSYQEDNSYDYIFTPSTQCIQRRPQGKVITQRTRFSGEGILRIPSSLPLITNIKIGKRDIAYEVASLSYTSPQSRILAMVSTQEEANSLKETLLRADLKIPLRDISEYNLEGPVIMVVPRKVALLFYQRLGDTINYILDTGLVNRWSNTWTNGKREVTTFLSPEEVKETLTLGSGEFIRLQEETSPLLPLVCPPRKSLLGPKTQKLIDLSPPSLLFPMISLASLIDSYEGNYFLGESSIIPFQGRNDLETLLNMWLDLLDFSGGLDNIPVYIKEWCQEKGVREEKLREVFIVVLSLLSTQEARIGPFDPTIFLEEVEDIILDVYPNSVRNIYEGRFYEGSTYVSRLINTNPREIYPIIRRDNLIWLATTSLLEELSPPLITIEEGFPT